MSDIDSIRDRELRIATQAVRDPWLTEKEAAKELRVSLYLVRTEREAGRLGFARLRRRVFYPLSAIETYKASLICPAKSSSRATPQLDDTTSHGRSAGALSGAALGLKIASSLKEHERPSSSRRTQQAR
ncbi:helix-turn-helix domain-containing protein [Sagittula sp.]|uniref:helix-turn-helix domain-containing protein n=1 Tax=Sagittula sp. TaxID=2038081 RepID=UPI003515737D